MASKALYNHTISPLYLLDISSCHSPLGLLTFSHSGFPETPWTVQVYIYCMVFALVFVFFFGLEYLSPGSHMAHSLSSCKSPTFFISLAKVVPNWKIAGAVLEGDCNKREEKRKRIFNLWCSPGSSALWFGLIHTICGMRMIIYPFYRWNNQGMARLSYNL